MNGIPTLDLTAAVFGCHSMFVLERHRRILWIDCLGSGISDERVRIPGWDMRLHICIQNV